MIQNIVDRRLWPVLPRGAHWKNCCNAAIHPSQLSGQKVWCRNVHEFLRSLAPGTIHCQTRHDRPSPAIVKNLLNAYTWIKWFCIVIDLPAPGLCSQVPSPYDCFDKYYAKWKGSSSPTSLDSVGKHTGMIAVTQPEPFVTSEFRPSVENFPCFKEDASSHPPAVAAGHDLGLLQVPPNMVYTPNNSFPLLLNPPKYQQLGSVSMFGKLELGQSDF